MLASKNTALLVLLSATGVVCGLFLFQLATDTSRNPEGEVIVARHTALVANTTEHTTESVSLPENPPVPEELQIPPLSTTTSYIRIIESCGPHFEGTCVNARTEPATSSPAVLKLRNNIVLRTDGVVEGKDGTLWHRIIFDEWVRYPARIRDELFVAEAYGEALSLPPPATLSSTTATSSKRILIDRSEQRLTAFYADGSVFMDQTISTGLDATPTPRGVFTIFHKTPSRYMQGPLPGISADYYDLPGVPWNLYFTEQGGAIHGAYWHDKFGKQWSHGCVNLPPEKAKELYLWAELGTMVTIRD